MDAPINEATLQEVNRYLDPLGWPRGMQMTLLRQCQLSPLRFFIIDDSGSMATTDGHQVMGTGKNKKIVNCTRWTELSESVRFLAGLAHAAGTPTEFRLLNGAQPMVIGQRDFSGQSDANLSTLLRVIQTLPGGGTPLCQHIRAVVAQINANAEALRKSGQRATVVICTDGEASDGNLVEAMAPLKTLPVNIVLRMCTDDDSVSEYWNRIDSQLELGLDILDDFAGEAKEVMSKNPWLVYGEPLHRMREWGVSLKEFDLLDEAKLSGEQMRAVCAYLLFGGNPRELPHPEAEWAKFEATVKTTLDATRPTWNPSLRCEEKLIHLSMLRKAYNKSGGGGCTIC